MVTCVPGGRARSVLAAGPARRFADVTSTDYVPALLERARERARADGLDIRFQTADAEALPFDDNAFDLVTGFNAFQFASDPVKALREAGRVTRPGGMVVVTTWGNPAGMDAASLIAAMKPMLPPAPPGAPGPFALSEETALRAFAVAGGLTPVTVFDVDSPWFYRDEATALRGFGAAGGATLARERVGEAAFNAAISAALAPFRQPDGSFRLGARSRCLVTTTDRRETR